MNLRKSVYGIAAFAACGMFVFASPMEAKASTALAGPGMEGGSYVATVNASTVNINASQDSDVVIAQATQGMSFNVLEDMGDGWLKIKVGSAEGFIPFDESISLQEEMEASDDEASLTVNMNGLEVTTEQRQNLVNYALQFVGGRYKYGGSDPHSGVDCSGFTRYVMANGAGVAMNRSSTAQSTQGVSIALEQIRPGDLIFYGNGSRINHVAMYIGNGQIVHASTYKTGIKVSDWLYRSPVKVVNVLGD